MAGPTARRGRRAAPRGRLSRSAEFDRVYRQGRSHANRVPRPVRVPARTRRGRPRGLGPVGLAQGRRRGRAQPRQAAAARGVRAAPATRCPDGHDVVIVARPDGGELAEREGLDGVRAGARGAARPLRRADAATRQMSRAGRRLVDRARSASTSGSSRRCSRPRCKYEPTCSALRRAGDPRVRHTARARARGLAAAALQPVEPRRLRPGRRAARLPRRQRRAPDRHAGSDPRLFIFANILQPLIDVFEAILRSSTTRVG